MFLARTKIETFGASLACESWVNIFNLDTFDGGLVFDECLQLVKRPAAKKFSQSFPAATPFLNALKCFEYDKGITFLSSLDYLFRQCVVRVRLQSLYFARQTFQNFIDVVSSIVFRSFGFFSLQRSYGFLSATSKIVQHFPAFNKAIRCCRDTINSAIHTEWKIPAWLRRLYVYVKAKIELVFVFFINQITRSEFTILQKISLIITKAQLDVFQPTVKRRDTYSFPDGVKPKEVMVEIERRRVEFLGRTFSFTEGLGDASNSSDDIVGGKRCGCFNVVIAKVVYIIRPSFIVFNSRFQCKITRIRETVERSREAFSFLISGTQFALNGLYHNELQTNYTIHFIGGK